MVASAIGITDSTVTPTLPGGMATIHRGDSHI